jgi:hypothetical protein
MAGPGVRRTDAGVQVRLPHVERAILSRLPDQLRQVLLGRARPEVGQRLFPPGSDDPEIEQEYRGLVGDDLVQARLAAVDRFAASLEAGEERRRMWVVELDDDEAHAWLSTLNDLRLVLAPLAGVASEEAWDAGPDHESPDSVLLYHLSWLQEQLLTALMTGLPDDD